VNLIFSVTLAISIVDDGWVIAEKIGIASENSMATTFLAKHSRNKGSQNEKEAKVHNECITIKDRYQMNGLGSTERKRLPTRSQEYILKASE
jgi:hypothetical protein